MRTLSLAILALFGALALPAAETFPVFKELPTPKPAGHRHYTVEEFKIDRNRIEKRKTELLYGDKAGLLALADFYRNDPDGKRNWANFCKLASDALNDWYFRKTGFERHIYWFFQIDTLGFIYALTGHEDLGRFIHDQMMQTVRLPQEFWLHSELRGYNRKRPSGQIETAQAARSASFAMDAAADVFTPAEITEARKHLREKALVPMVNYLKDTKTTNNFLAIIGTGAFVTAKYLEDSGARALAKAALDQYVNESVEPDGSYGEGTGYFSYPANGIVPAIAAMTVAERRNFLLNSGLLHSARWLAYPYLYATDGRGKMTTLRTVYGDNSYSEVPPRTLLLMLASSGNDGVAEWLGATLSPDPRTWKYADWRYAPVYAGEKLRTKMRSPAEASYPLVAAFENGENFIRSGWEPDGIVLSLYTAGPTRVNYAHQRPERNSINLGAYGEYFIISPHSASYRSPIHYEYDLTTLAANTVMIDGKSQLFPTIGGWGTRPPEHSVIGNPVAKLVRSGSGPVFDYLEGDARLCYQEKPETALRTVLYHRAKKYFVVIDRLKDAKAPHTYTARWQLNNRDGKLGLTGVGGETLLAARPGADLAVSTFSSVPLSRDILDGYMHGVKRDYSPGGEYEGKPGSAKVLAVSNASPTKEFTLFTVLQPLKKGEKTVSCKFNGGTLSVDGEPIPQ